MTDALLMIDLKQPRLTPDERAFLGERRVGGVCLFARNVEDRVQLGELTAELRALLGPDVLIAVDQEGGAVVRVRDVPYPPSMMALGAADDLGLTRKMGAMSARGLRAVGVNVNFAPVADVNHNPRNPVIAERAFGGDPEAVARHVAAFVAGHQEAGVGAVVKHFPGHGDTDLDSHLELPHLAADAARLERLELPPFRRAVAAGVAGVMSAHIVLPALDPALPATLSRAVLTGLLRERLGFDGVIFTDALDMRAIAASFAPAEAALRAVAAGADMALYLGPLKEHEAILRRLEAGLASGELDPEAVARARARLRALARRFPVAPAPEAAWEVGDEARLEAAAFRGTVALGELPKLEPGARVTLVAAAAVAAGGASSAVRAPAEALAAALEGAGVRVTRAFYARGAEGASVLGALAGPSSSSSPRPRGPAWRGRSWRSPGPWRAP